MTHSKNAAHSVDDHEVDIGLDTFAPPRMNEVPATKGEASFQGHGLRLRMQSVGAHVEPGQQVHEIGLPQGVVDKVLSNQKPVSMRDDSLVVFVENTKPPTVARREVGKARIVGLWRGMRVRFALEIVGKNGDVVTDLNVEADTMEVIDNEIYIKLKKVEGLLSEAGHG